MGENETDGGTAGEIEFTDQRDEARTVIAKAMHPDDTGFRVVSGIGLAVLKIRIVHCFFSSVIKQMG